jgi:hypothetical protein
MAPSTRSIVMFIFMASKQVGQGLAFFRVPQNSADENAKYYSY